ncbi:hypothetical protein Rhow_000536 [Rhodococcus wratislaviensis]|uniref:Uncharacterized protein n=1 Tax=Rhodococcus wratislaviensis TaxID=44752 RepID=A0A402CMP9_RHOWR|nr:hypothetical protein Rhow_000536 [Rhodococcus wratislaviensis]
MSRPDSTCLAAGERELGAQLLVLGGKFGDRGVGEFESLLSKGVSSSGDR